MSGLPRRPEEGTGHTWGIVKRQSSCPRAESITIWSREPAASPGLGSGSRNGRRALHLCTEATAYVLTCKMGFVTLRLTWSERISSTCLGPSVVADAQSHHVLWSARTHSCLS